MKTKLQLAAILMAFIASCVLSQSSQAAGDTSPKNKPIPLDQLPPCTNPDVCGGGTEKRPDFTLKTIFIDVGHGGGDGGAQRDGVYERDLTLQQALMYRKVFEENGAIVILDRAIDLRLGLDERVAAIKRLQPDLAISVHINSSEGETTASGIETYYTTPESKALAEFIHKAVLKATGAKDRGIHQNNFYIPKNSPVPTILLEHGFINNPDERKLLSSPEYQRKFADGAKQGLQDYYKSLEKKTAPATPAPTPVPNRQGLIDGQESTQEKSSGPSYAPFFKVQPDGEWPGCQGF